MLTRRHIYPSGTAHSLRKAASLVAAAALLCALTPLSASAVKLSAAAIFIEVNDTDGDAGIQVFFDGTAWRRMRVRAPNGKVIMDVRTSGSVRKQGITEMFLESAEPSFDDQTLEELLALFPKGLYRFQGRTKDGKPLTGRARLTHAIPGAAVITRPAQDADDVDPNRTIIRWKGVAKPRGSRIVGYEVIVERDVGKAVVFKADVGPKVRSVTVPKQFMESGKPYKVEVLAIEKSGNQTIAEREFETR